MTVLPSKNIDNNKNTVFSSLSVCYKMIPQRSSYPSLLQVVNVFGFNWEYYRCKVRIEFCTRSSFWYLWIFLSGTEVRLEACDCLLNMLRDEIVQKTPECRVLLERAVPDVFFCSDKENRTKLVSLLSWDEVLSLDQHTERLVLEYKTRALEINTKTIHQSTSSFVSTGAFQGGPVRAREYINIRASLLKFVA